MSAEGKKKRGQAGLTNAQSIPFRYGGRPCNYSTAHGNPRSKYGAGSKLVGAMIFGALMAGSRFNPSQRLVEMTDAAMGRCTHPLHSHLDDTEDKRAAA